MMDGLRRVLPVVTVFLTTTALDAQVRIPDRETAHADFEAGLVSSYSLGVRTHVAPLVGDELFHGIATGVALGVEAGVHFDNSLSLGTALTGAFYSDDLADEAASTIDLTVEAAKTWETDGWDVELGPVAGYEWLDRGIQVERVGGLIVGGRVGLSRWISGSLRLGTDVFATWSTVSPSPRLKDFPPDPDARASGHQIGVRVSIAHHWLRR